MLSLTCYLPTLDAQTAGVTCVSPHVPLNCRTIVKIKCGSIWSGSRRLSYIKCQWWLLSLLHCEKSWLHSHSAPKLIFKFTSSDLWWFILNNTYSLLLMNMFEIHVLFLFYLDLWSWENCESIRWIWIFIQKSFGLDLN